MTPDSLGRFPLPPRERLTRGQAGGEGYESENEGNTTERHSATTACRSESISRSHARIGFVPNPRSATSYLAAADVSETVTVPSRPTFSHLGNLEIAACSTFRSNTRNAWPMPGSSPRSGARGPYGNALAESVIGPFRTEVIP